MKHLIPLMIAALSATPGLAETAVLGSGHDTSLSVGSNNQASEFVEHCGWSNCSGDRPGDAFNGHGIVVVGNDCSLSALEQFVGHNISVTESMPDLFMRVFSPDFLVGTTDYWPNRFNFMTDGNGTITGASCG